MGANMKKLFFFFFLFYFTFFTYSKEGIDTAKKFVEPEFIRANVKKFTFSYRIDKGNLAVKVSCQTKGWVAIGFNPTKRMKDANIIIGCYDNGKEIAVDHFGVSSTGHKADTLIGGKNDIVEFSCVEKEGKTTVSFTIPLNSGDEKDVVLKQGEETTVIFAAGRKDNLKTKHFTLAKIKVVF